MAMIWTYLLTVLIVVVGHVTSDVCYNYDGLYTQTTLYCTYGCCGGNGYQYCCSYTYVYTYLSGGVVAGIVIGCLIVVGVPIAIVVCCCCLRRRRAASGQVINTNANPWLSTTTSGMRTTQLPMGVYPPNSQLSPQMAGGYTPYAYDNTVANSQFVGAPSSYNQAGKS